MKMRICPECGYEDNPLWENDRFKRDLQVMRLEDFKRQYPHLAQRIENEDYVQEGQFVYHKTSQYVLRKEPFEDDEPFWQNFEAHRNRRKEVVDYYNRERSDRGVQRKLHNCL